MTQITVKTKEGIDGPVVAGGRTFTSEPTTIAVDELVEYQLTAIRSHEDLEVTDVPEEQAQPA